MPKIISILVFTLLSCQILLAQYTVTGVVVDADNVPLANIDVRIGNNATSTNLQGQYTINNVPDGQLLLTLSGIELETLDTLVTIAGSDVNLGPISMNTKEGLEQVTAEDIIPTVTLSETDLVSSGGASVSGILTASRDPFISAAAFTFGTYRFRIRGYDSDNTEVYVNGVLMNDLAYGSAFWSQWGGLNDVFRNRENNIGIEPLFYGVGGVGGVSHVDTRASTQRKQVRLGYAASNRSYNHRITGTYSSGMLPKNWAVSLAGSRRWAKEGYVDGTFYDAWSYFFAIDKVLGDHTLSLSTFAAYIKRGQSSPAIQEVYDLAGTNYYNPNWGYQDGEKRNARVRKTFLPTTHFNYEWKMSEKARLFVAAGIQSGQNGNTSLNWLNASDPRPNYYRNLPSYIEDSTLAALATERFETNPDLLQLDWDGLYQVNYNSTETIENYNGTGRDTTVNLAKYVVEQRRFDHTKFNASVLYERQFAESANFQLGLSHNFQRTYNFKVVDDLLGASVFVDINQFAERDFRDDEDAIQNDVDNPNRLLYEGDRYGYDYDITNLRSDAWAYVEDKGKKLDMFATARFTHSRFYRTGNVRSGLFPDNSLGDSEKKDYYNYTIKAGATYKANGRNFVFLNAAYVDRAPLARHAFVSPRTRNQLANGLESEKIRSIEVGYLLKSPKIKARAVFYHTQFNDGVRSYSFYYDIERNFVNITLTNIDKRHLGGEFAIEGKVTSRITLVGVAAIGQNIYTSRQKATISLDNNAEVLAEDMTVYSKNFWVANGPQMAGTIGINYRSSKSWFFNLNFSYLDRIWLDFNPIRRTEEALDLVNPESQLFQDIVQQERMDGQFSLDFFGGYFWRLDRTFDNMDRRMDMYFLLGVNNLTNNKNFVTGGFEQTRLDVNDRDPASFPPRLFYAYGTNFFAMITLKF